MLATLVVLAILLSVADTLLHASTISVHRLQIQLRLCARERSATTIPQPNETQPLPVVIVPTETISTRSTRPGGFGVWRRDSSWNSSWLQNECREPSHDAQYHVFSGTQAEPLACDSRRCSGLKRCRLYSPRHPGFRDTPLHRKRQD